MDLKVGDKVRFTCLLVPGTAETAKFGTKEGTITKIAKAGELGARAMDCTVETDIYWVSTGSTLYPKFREELNYVD